jgi:dipeptidyl aminopeptidase/acylaminoacyl peptidase
MGDRETRPHGEWPSPVGAEALTEGRREFGPVAVDGGTAYWLEVRPGEDGRGVVVRETEGGHEDVTPAGWNVRTLVHEYGGGDFAVDDGTVYFADYGDQRLYRQDPGLEPEPITPEPATERGDRFADFEVSPDGERIYCVRERHGGEGEGEPENHLVVLPTDGSHAPDVVAEGADFYSFPRLDAAGDRIAWTTWDHPRMPWDGTELHVAGIEGDGTLADERTVLGGPEESVFQPAWGPNGLYAVSDRTGWWNLYRVDPRGEDGPVNLHPREAEFGVPQWAFGTSTYAVRDDGSIAVVVTEAGRRRLGVLDPGDEPRKLRYPETTGWVHKHPKVVADGDEVVVPTSRTDAPAELRRLDPDSGAQRTLRTAGETDLDPAYVSEPERLAFPTDDDTFDAHGFYYPPNNPDVAAPEGDAPPVVVTVHGGPTSQTVPEFDLERQYFTTRGIGVLDLNYRGSTGYGRAYRERLTGQWGVVDAADCANAAEFLAESGRADPNRLAIRGGSAGGYAVLCSLAFHDAFDAGVSYYGVSDLAALAEATHKFESRYLDSLVGPYPEAEAVYRERSPVHHADGIECPLLLLQGDEDPVVPPEQSESMLAALDENGVPSAYVEFEGEQHGFRKAESIRRAAEAELAFLGRVFGFDPDDEVEGIQLDR